MASLWEATKKLATKVSDGINRNKYDSSQLNTALLADSEAALKKEEEEKARLEVESRDFSVFEQQMKEYREKTGTEPGAQNMIQLAPTPVRGQIKPAVKPSATPPVPVTEPLEETASGYVKPKFRSRFSGPTSKPKETSLLSLSELPVIDPSKSLSGSLAQKQGVFGTSMSQQETKNDEPELDFLKTADEFSAGLESAVQKPAENTVMSAFAHSIAQEQGSPAVTQQAPSPSVPTFTAIPPYEPKPMPVASPQPEIKPSAPVTQTQQPAPATQSVQPAQAVQTVTLEPKVEVSVKEPEIVDPAMERSVDNSKPIGLKIVEGLDHQYVFVLVPLEELEPPKEEKPEVKELVTTSVPASPTPDEDERRLANKKVDKLIATSRLVAKANNTKEPEACYYVEIRHLKTLGQPGSIVIMRSCNMQYVWTNAEGDGGRPNDDICPCCGKRVEPTVTTMD